MGYNRLSIAIFYLLAFDAIYRILAVFFALPIWPSSMLVTVIGAISLTIVGAIFIEKSWLSNMPFSIFLVIALILSIALSLLIQYFVFDEVIDFRGASSIAFPRLIFAAGSVWLFCGCIVQGVNVRRSNFFAGVLLLILSYCVYSSLRGGLVVSYADLSEGRSDGQELNHLVIGEAATYLLALCLAFTSLKWRPAVVLISLGILFSLGGRTALFTYILALLVFLFLRGKLIRYAVVLGLLSVVALIYILNFVNFDLGDSAISRMLLIGGIQLDESVVARELFFWEGLKELPNQVLAGDASFLIARFGEIGTYIHSIFSAWQFFGLVPFVIFIISIIYISRYIWRHRFMADGPVDDFGTFIFIYATISVLTGKSIVYLTFWFVIGFWLFRIATIRNLRTPSSGRASSLITN